MRKDIEYVVVSQSWVKKLAQFFKDIVAYKDDEYFHPHPFTYEKAKKIATYEGNDLYFLQIKNNEITGYAMLRGWDEGYEMPSLGIAIHPDFRRHGLGKDFMLFLHEQARARGAKKIRLKTYPENIGALNLYQNLGYDFLDREDEQLVGFLEL